MMLPARDPLIRMMLAYDGPLPGYTPRAPVKTDIRKLSTEALRRHAGLALSVNRFDVSAEYQAELSRRAIPLNEMEEAT